MRPAILRYREVVSLTPPASSDHQGSADLRLAGMAEPHRSLEIGEIFSLHNQRVSVWVRRLGGPGIEVDDAVQEVFLRAHRRLHHFKGQERLIVWLYRITEYVVRDQRRATRRRRRMLSDSPSQERLAGEVPSAGLLPPEQVSKGEGLRLVYAALDRMSERSRNLLILFEFEEFSGQEIAELKGAKVATVWVWLHRARAEFWKHMNELRSKPQQSRSEPS
jgi:RNA polymerase sigma-70 factor, ECF subfamily